MAIKPEDIEPFRPNVPIPYTPSESNDFQNQLLRDWAQIWDRYQYEMKHHVGCNFTQQYIEHPSRYRLRDTIYDASLSTSPCFPPVDPSSEDNEPLGRAKASYSSSHSDHLRAWSISSTFEDTGLSAQKQWSSIVNQVTSHGKLGILTISVASGTQKSYQPA